MTGETFEDFKNSFSYGSRNDLSFKFLKSLSPDRAAFFFAQMLEALGETFDDGDAMRLVDLAIEWQIEGYRRKDGQKITYEYAEGPFTAPQRSLDESTVALVTSSGHFESDNDPEPLGVEDMSQQEAIDRIGEFLKQAPDLSPIAMEPGVDLTVRHGGYDIRGSQRDRNVTFPIERLSDLAAEGTVGSIHDTGYSFVGAAAQGRIRKETGPELASSLAAAGVDVALLVPV